MTPTKPGYYWTTPATGKRVVVQVVSLGCGLMVLFPGNTSLYSLDFFSHWSEKLNDPKESQKGSGA